MFRKTKAEAAPGGGLVERVRRQAGEAQALARVAGQELLESAATNPEVRDHVDGLRVARLREAEDAAHRRYRRRARVRDLRADHAVSALVAVQDAQDATSPARAVERLASGRRARMRVALGASIGLSAGSAIGIGSLIAAMGSPAWAAYPLAALTEVGLTFLSTTAILYRGHLAEHRATGAAIAAPGHLKALWALMAVPLAVSMTLNIIALVVAPGGLGAAGAACAAGAAAFAGFAYLVVGASAQAIEANRTRIDDAELDELERVALDLDNGPADPVGDGRPDVDDPALTVKRLEALTSALARDEALWGDAVRARAEHVHALGGIPDDVAELTQEPSVTEELDAAGAGGAAVLDPDHAHPVAQGVPTPEEDDDLDVPRDGHQAPLDPSPAAVRAYRKTHPEASISAIARAFRISRRTVRRYLDDTPTSGGGDS